MNKAKPIARIDDWAYMGSKPTYLVGRILGHPKQDKLEGNFHMTSTILVYNPEIGYCETENTIYILGRMREYP